MSTLINQLMERAHAQCELCAQTEDLSVSFVSPSTEENKEKSLLICQECLSRLENNNPAQDENYWRCLSDSMWSEHPAVQVTIWRQLKRLANANCNWAQDLLEQMYLEEEALQWAKSGFHDNSKTEDNNQPQTKDSNGTPLLDGDSVTLIKDLVVKGANFTAKRGTIVRKISLTSNPEQIEGKVNGTQIVLLTCFLKKA